MKPPPSFLGVAALAGVVALGFRQVGGSRSGVAPWDVPDAPNPSPTVPPGSPLLGDPPRLVRADGPGARLDDGTTVELVSVARTLNRAYPEPLPDARPAWNPDGTPDLAPWREPGEVYGRPAAELENRGARWLTFRVAAPTEPKATSATVTGYVPDGARQGVHDPLRHGWDIVDRNFWVPRDGPGLYATCVVVDDRRASHYRFALARGPWQVAADVPIVATDEGAAVLARGPWGTLRRTPPKKEPPERSFSAHIMPSVSYVVEPPPDTPPAFATEVRVLDTKGRPNARIGRWAANPRGDMRFPGPAVHVEVATRPYEWVEFSNVHYDPDPAKWPKGYWGEEGAGKVSRADGVALEALIHPGPGTYPGGWRPREVYAPDGRLWRNHPDPRALSPAFSGLGGSSDRLVAAFRFDAGRVSGSTPARVEGFAADGAIPGKGLRGSLKPARAWAMTRDTDQYAFERPESPFVQFAVRYASDRWTKAGETPVPHVVFPLVKPENRAGYDDGSSSNAMFSVILRSNGTGDLYWHKRSPDPDAPGYDFRSAFTTWPKDEEARVVARLKSGRKVLIPHNSVGSSGDGTTSASVEFNQASDSDPVYDTTRLDPKGGLRLKLSEIAAFEVETRGFSDPVYVAARLPAR